MPNRSEQRHISLDALRGIAVMGILLMNITAFAMPEAAYIQPTAFGGTSFADLSIWALNMVLVEGKMRGLFSLLFGASMLLVWQGAESRAGNGNSVHLRRMGWLLVFGLLHYFLIWTGDILALYALCGMAGVFLLRQDEAQLKTGAIVLFAMSFLILCVIAAMLLYTRYAASLPGADAEALKSYQETMSDLSGAPAATAREIALFRGRWTDIAGHVAREDWAGPLELLLVYGVETLGFMSLGMAMLRNGFLTGGWSQADYARMARRCYGWGLPPLIAMVAALWATGFDGLWTFVTLLALAIPFRIMVTLGHAALALWIIRRFSESGLVGRIAAAGRAAFTNYLGTSLLMTGLFYGWGLGQFGHWSRWQVYLVVPLVWVLMLVWSKPWLDRFRYGPLEWLWRSLARGEIQPMRRERGVALD